MGWLGMLVGAAIDRQDGDSGIRGAIIGGATQKAVGLLAPVAVTFAIGWGVQYALRRGIAALGDGRG